MKKYVVLFDLDGTLVTGPADRPSAGLLAMTWAASRVSSASSELPLFDFAGMTDVQIARRLITAAGDHPAEDRIAALLEHYLDHLEEQVRHHPYTALGDPASAVSGLLAAGAVVGLGTGNLLRGGTIKLESAGIHHLFDMALGGYAADGDTRTELLACGAKRCDLTGTLPVIVVGDTPLDIEAAKGIGARCLGVPYRSNTAQILRDFGADGIIEQVDENLATTIGNLIG